MGISNWVPIVELELGQVVADKISVSFGNTDVAFDAQAVKNNSLDVDISLLDDRIIANEAAIAKPLLRGSMRLSVDATQVIEDAAAPVVLGAFDTKVTQRGNIAVNSAHKTITYTGAGLSSAILTIGLNVEFAATEELEVYLYVNDLAYSDTPLNIQGGGTGKPVELFWQSDIALSTGDVFDIRGRNADVGNFDILYKRSAFRIEE